MRDPGPVRRMLLVALIVVGTAAASRLLASILAAHGLSWREIAILALFTVTFAWISLSFWTALAGFARVAFMSAPPRAGGGLREPRPGAPIGGRTALVMPVYHEDVAEVGARLAAIYRSLERSGHLEHFDVLLLSDSRCLEVVRAEEALWARLCAELGAAGRLFYRRRADNRGRKSGNIAEFCRRWGRRYDYMVVLDADSVMAGATIVRLVRLLEANPRTALIQTVPQPVRGGTLFARIHQFAARLYSPLFAAGCAFWYPGKSNYWGHNAIIRLDAFTACCGLPPLPGRPPLGGEILSHDFVEAALLQRRGWEVWLEPALGGSYEELPPTLDDYAKRDLRWCQGNLQHARLLRVKGFSAVSRGHLITGVMAYLASPLWFLLLVLTTIEAIRHDPAQWVYFPHADTLFPVWPIPRAFELIGLFGVTLGMLFLPKLLAIFLALGRSESRRAFGGAARLAKSALAELVFSAVLAPVLMLQQTRAVLATLAGHQVTWNGQNRSCTGRPSWPAIRPYVAITVLGAAWGAIAHWYAPELLLWLTPVLAGMLLAIPLACLTGDLQLGAGAARRGWFLIPEEVAPPAELAELPAPFSEDRPPAPQARLAADPEVPFTPR